MFVYVQVLAAGNREHKDLEALLGKAVCLERKEQFAPALELLNQVVVGYPWFLPALVEKARLLLALDDWEQAMETAQRILAQDAQNIEALRLTVLFLLARESRYGVAAQVRRIFTSRGAHIPCVEGTKEPKRTGEKSPNALERKAGVRATFQVWGEE